MGPGNAHGLGCTHGPGHPQGAGANAGQECPHRARALTQGWVVHMDHSPGTCKYAGAADPRLCRGRGPISFWNVRDGNDSDLVLGGDVS